MSGNPLVVCPGTGVAQALGFSLGPWAYRHVRSLCAESQLRCLWAGGILPLSWAYPHFSKTIDELARKSASGRIDGFMHSQPVVHCMQKIAENPERFGTVLLVAGPIWGTKTATREPLSRFPCSRYMVTGHPYLAARRESLAETLATLPKRDRPRVICVSAYRDDVVVPSRHSNLVVPGVENYVLGYDEPKHRADGVAWIRTKARVHHFSLISDRDTLAFYKWILAGNVHRDAIHPSRRPPKRPVRPAKPVKVAAAA